MAKTQLHCSSKKSTCSLLLGTWRPRNALPACYRLLEEISAQTDLRQFIQEHLQEATTDADSSYVVNKLIDNDTQDAEFKLSRLFGLSL